MDLSDVAQSFLCAAEWGENSYIPSPIWSIQWAAAQTQSIWELAMIALAG